MEHCLPLVSCSGGGTLPPSHVLRVAGTIAKEWTRRPDGIAGFEMRRLILKLRSHQTWPRRPSSRQCALNMIDELAMLRSSIAAETREGPRVRISFPPAESQLRTCLSREFVFLRREAAVFRGCARLAWRRGRQRRAGCYKISPTGDNISIAPYSSTAVPLLESARMPHRSE